VASLIPFSLDLTAYETTRLAAVLNALGPQWNPFDIYLSEAQAHRMLSHRMLYGHLDADQQATYDVLLATGALPDSRRPGHDARSPSTPRPPGLGALPVLWH
jgi:hypothetical protein